MAITGPASYVPTANGFITHWTAANTALGAAGPLKTKDGKTVANLTTHRDTLEGFQDSVQDKLNGLEIAAGVVVSLKTALVARAGEFNRRVRGSLGNSPFARALPEAPQVTDGAASVLTALRDIKSLWPRINAATIPNFTPPLLMPDGYAVATFLTDLAALVQAYEDEEAAGQLLTLEREHRNDVQDLAYPIMRDYRTALLGSFAPEHALVASLPRLTPEPGATPDPVPLSGSYNSVAQEAVFTWPASTNPNLAKYQLRRCPGATYTTETEIVVQDIAAGTLTVSTSAGLLNPGDTASYRLYVILTTDNEAGSNTITILRPVTP
jgi:hypothetical protein